MAVRPDQIDHVYSIFINAPPERVWRAITDGDETVQYYFGTRVQSDWNVGSAIRYDYPDGTVAADGEVIAMDPPRRLEMTFHAHWDPEIEAEGPVRQVWEIEPGEHATKLTVTQVGLTARQAEEFGGGMVFIVSGLKSVAEGTGAAVPAG